MRTAIILLLFCLPIAAAESDLDKLVLALASEDFDVRESATNLLGDFPVAYAKIFIRLSVSFKSDDPEVEWRLKAAAKLIFERKVLPNDERWRRTMAKVEMQFSRTGDALIVENAYGDWDLMRQGDMITHIDGKPLCELEKDVYFGWGVFRANSKVELTVRRLKEKEIERPDGDEFSTTTITVNVGEKENLSDCADTLVQIYAEAWHKFEQEHKLFSEIIKEQK